MLQAALAGLEHAGERVTAEIRACRAAGVTMRTLARVTGLDRGTLDRWAERPPPASRAATAARARRQAR